MDVLDCGSGRSFQNSYIKRVLKCNKNPQQKQIKEEETLKSFCILFFKFFFLHDDEENPRKSLNVTKMRGIVRIEMKSAICT